MRISACVITKNEEQNLPACLKSIKSIVSEIIVVDTGSIDKTMEIAKQFNAKIYKFEWIGDFSAARNYAISKATGEWIIFLDADERFDSKSVGSIIPIIRLARKQKKQAVACLLSNVNNNNELINSLMALRIFKNDPYIRYKGSIHEYISYRKGTIQAFNALNQLQIWHSGYSTEEIERKDKGNRNRELLLKELVLNPTSSDINFYISEAYLIENNYELGLKYALKAKELKTWKMFGLSQKNYLNMLKVTTYKLKNPLEKVSAMCQEALNEFPTFPDFNIFQAELFLLENRFEDAIEFYNIAINHMDEVLTSQSGSYKNLDLILADLAKCYYKTNQTKLSIENYVESLKFNKYNLNSLIDFITILSKYDQAKDIEKFLAKIYDIFSPRDTLYLLKAALFTSNKELCLIFYSYLDQDSKETFKQEKAELYLLTGDYTSALTMFHKLFEETAEERFLEKAFVASLLYGNELFEQEIKNTLPSLRNFGEQLMGSTAVIKENEYSPILNALTELISLSKENMLIELVDLIEELNLSHQIAEILYKREKYEIALLFYEKYLDAEVQKSENEMARTYIKIAESLFKLGHFELSLQFLQDAKSINPKNYDIYRLGVWISEKLHSSEQLSSFVISGIEEYPNSKFIQNYVSQIN